MVGCVPPSTMNMRLRARSRHRCWKTGSASVLAVVTSKYGGEYRNQLTGKKVGQEETKSAYATLTFKPFDDFKMRSRISWQKDDDGPLALFLQGAADNNCRPGFRSARFRARSGALPFAPAVLSSTNTNQFFCGVIRPQPNNVRLHTDPLPITIPAYPGIPGVFGATPAISGNFDGTAYDGITNEQLTMTNIIDWDPGRFGLDPVEPDRLARQQKLLRYRFRSQRRICLFQRQSVFAGWFDTQPAGQRTHICQLQTATTRTDIRPGGPVWPARQMRRSAFS